MSLVAPNPPTTVNVYGYVYDYNSGAQIQGATVRFIGRNEFFRDGNHYNINEEVVTDVDGRFQKVLPATKEGANVLTIVDVIIEYTDSQGDDVVDKRAIIIDETLGVTVEMELLLVEEDDSIVIFSGPQGPQGPAGSVGVNDVADIDNPVELNAVGLAAGDLIAARQVNAGAIDDLTFYVYDADGPAVNAPYVMATNDGGTTRWVAVAGKFKNAHTAVQEGRTTFIPFGEMADMISNYSATAIATNGQAYASFHIPHEFRELISLELIGIPTGGAAGANKDIDLNSSYAFNGQNLDTNTESSTATLYDFTGLANQITKIDLSGVFTAIQAGHYCGLEVDHNGIGGTIYYLGIDMRWR